MKRTITTMLAALVLMAAITGCASNNKPDGSSSSSGSSETGVKTPPTLTEIRDAVKKAYGENYLPNTPIDEKLLDESYGITLDNVEEYIAESPMISMNPDIFIAMKAKEGKKAAVQAELEKYRDYLINESLQYPSNMEKAKNATVVEYGDYVFLLMLGGINPNNDATEEEQATFAKEQMKLGLDVIDGMLK